MSLGPLQILLIIVVILLLFGAGKIPRLMGDVAKGINAFKKGLKDDDEPPSAKQIDKNGGEPPARG
jgi:sec-independent protein translocase protein TatA